MVTAPNRSGSLPSAAAQLLQGLGDERVGLDPVAAPAGHTSLHTTTRYTKPTCANLERAADGNRRVMATTYRVTHRPSHQPGSAAALSPARTHQYLLQIRPRSSLLARTARLRPVPLPPSRFAVKSAPGFAFKSGPPWNDSPRLPEGFPRRLRGGAAGGSVDDDPVLTFAWQIDSGDRTRGRGAPSDGRCAETVSPRGTAPSPWWLHSPTTRGGRLPPPWR